MVKPVSDGSKYTRGYQQALNDLSRNCCRVFAATLMRTLIPRARAWISNKKTSVVSLFERAHAPTALNSSPACHPIAGAVVSFPFGVLWLLAPKWMLTSCWLNGVLDLPTLQGCHGFHQPNKWLSVWSSEAQYFLVYGNRHCAVSVLSCRVHVIIDTYM